MQSRVARRYDVRLALVTEGMIHRSIDDLMDWLDAAAPAVRDAAAPSLAVNLDPSHLFWQRMDPIAVINRLGPLIGYAHAKDVRYTASELDLNGLLDGRWPGDPAAIAWDFAAVGRGAHDAAWWSSFTAALSRHTRAGVLSIEHEDRLVAPEDGVAESARLLARTS